MPAPILTSSKSFCKLIYFIKLWSFQLKMGIMLAPTHKVIVRIKWNNAWKMQNMVSSTYKHLAILCHSNCFFNIELVLGYGQYSHLTILSLSGWKPINNTWLTSSTSFITSYHQLITSNGSFGIFHVEVTPAHQSCYVWSQTYHLPPKKSPSNLPTVVKLKNPFVLEDS